MDKHPISRRAILRTYRTQRKPHVLKVTSMNQVAYLLTPSDDLELQLEGSLRGSRDPLFVTELKDFEDVGPECQPLGVRLLST